VAIDTRNKRASVAAAGVLFLVAWPAPDGTIGSGDRRHVAALYSGLAGIPIEVTGRLALVDSYTALAVESYRPEAVESYSPSVVETV